MLSQQENEQLTRFGAGTPMGELLRRYWWPVAGNSELAKKPTRAVKLLGESLTLYKDKQGRLGLVAERCPHRGVALVHGYPEQEGLRCIYHGWLFDQTGQCVETPAEDPSLNFKDRVKITAYPVQELGGLIWAYLGPLPAPILPKWDLFTWDNVVRQVGVTVIPCNWLQCMENSADPVHTEWLHGWFFKHVLDTLEAEGKRPTEWPDEALLGFQRHHEKIDFQVYQHGMMKRRLLEGVPEDADDWRIGHPLVFPNMVRIPLMGSGASFQIRVPMDDTTTLHLEYDCFVPPPGVESFQPDPREAPWFNVPFKDAEGNFISDYILSQDLLAWVGQGEIADRTNERLAPSDRGVILYRRLLKEQMEAVQRGEDPMNVFRDPSDDRPIELSPREYGRSFTYGQFSLKRQQTGVYSPLIPQLEEMYAQTLEALMQRS
jgi:5,5'-dehydrodivanillate O-demethylase